MRWLSLSNLEIYLIITALLGLIVVAYALRARQRAQAELRRQSHQLAALHETALELTARLDLDNLLENIVARACALAHTPHCNLMLLEPDGTEMTMRVTSGIEKDFLHVRTRLGEGLVGQVWATGQPLVINNYLHWAGRRPEPAYDIFRAVIGVPIFSGAQVVGVLSLDHLDSGRTFSEQDVSLLKQLAQLASVALENARLYAAAQREVAERAQAEERLRQRNDYLAALNEMIIRLSAQLEVAEILEGIVRRAGQLAGTPHGYLDVVEGDGLEPKIGIGALNEAVRHKVKPGEGLAGVVWQTGEPLVVNDYDAWAGRVSGYSQHTIRAVMGVPLKSGGRVVGVLGLAHDFTTTLTFGPEEVELMVQFAQLAVIALDNAQAFEKERAARTQAETLREVTRALSASLDREQVLTIILEQLARMVNYDSASVMLITGLELEIVAHRGLPLAGVPSPRLPMKMLVNIQEVVSSRRPLIIDDVAQDTRWQWLDVNITDSHMHNWLGVPLLAHHQVIGLLNLDKHQPGFYTDHHAEIAAAFAAQAAIAIENARLFAEMRRMAERQTLLYDVLSLVGKQFDAEEICRIAVEAIVLSAHWLSVAISLPTEDGQGWIIRAAGGVIPAKFGIRHSMHQGVIGRAYRTGQTQAVPDVSFDPDYFPGHASVQSQLAIPIKQGERVLGVLNLESNQLSGFNNDDKSLAESIAEAVALALENARLFAVVEKASMSDGLTGLANRRHFDEVLEREWKRARRLHTSLALLMLDVDCFKLYNDTYGHPTGDEGLRQVAGVLTKAAQRSVDLAARYGGEEFALILPDTTAEGAAHVAEHICAGLLALRIPHGASKYSDWLTISCGFATLIPDSDSEASALLVQADEALYQAKRRRILR